MLNSKGIAGKVILITCGGLLVLFVLFIALVFGLASKGNEGPIKAAEEFLDTMSSRELEKAYYSTSGAFQKEVSKDQFMVFAEQYPILVKKEKVSFSQRSTNNDTAVLSGTITGDGGKKSPITINLVKEGEV